MSAPDNRPEVKLSVDAGGFVHRKTRAILGEGKAARLSYAIERLVLAELLGQPRLLDRLYDEIGRDGWCGHEERAERRSDVPQLVNDNPPGSYYDPPD